MARKRKRRLVIDASVARSASQSSGSSSKRGSCCRDFLLKVLKDCFHVAMTCDVYDEWKVHESGFARTWRISMVARRKLHVADASANATLDSRVLATTNIDTEQFEMDKDLHLIRAAMQTDNCVVSLDNVARDLFVAAAAAVKEISGIDWLNPETEFDGIVDWLDRGAPDGEFGLR
jgi:hypothetical protein